MQLIMADRIVKSPIGILHDLLVKVKSFIFPPDIDILDCEMDFEVHIILGMPLFATGHAMVNMGKGQMMFRLNNEDATLNIRRSMKKSCKL